MDQIEIILMLMLLVVSIAGIAMIIVYLVEMYVDDNVFGFIAVIIMSTIWVFIMILIFIYFFE